METNKYLKKISVWDKEAAIHILSRTTFGYKNTDIEFALSKSLDDFIENYLLASTSTPQAPLFNGIDWTSLPHNSENSPNYTNWKNSLIFWWLDLMLQPNISFREKMVWFLSNHFVSEYSTVSIPQLIYIQNKLFREFVFGDFIELTKRVTVDPAMLRYLNGDQNTKKAPNENYARELMELFTIGIGNYSEDDIKEAAKALTGWQVNYTTLTSFLNSTRYDSGNKTVFGKTNTYNHLDLINLLFSEKAVAASEFICNKLYKEFVYYNPNNVYVSQLAAVMRDNNFNLKPVLSTMLKSEYFHSKDIRGAKIKSPIEFLSLIIKQYNINYDNDLLNNIRSKSTTLMQEILNPPDVRGWEGQRKWVNTTSYPTRNLYSDSFITGIKIGSKTFKVDVLPFARSFSSSENAIQFVEDTVKLLVPYPLSQIRKDSLLLILLDGTAVENWSTNSTNAAKRLENYFKALMRLPEYQLS